MRLDSRIYIAGHDGMVGSAIMRNLEGKGFNNILTSSYPEVDLIRQDHVESLISRLQPEYVIDAAAKVGGILSNNTYRGQFIYENMMIQNNLIHAAHENEVKKLLFLGSSCIYPKHAVQPMKEEYLLTDRLESTNEPYAIAKIAGIKMCESYYRQYGSNFISVMPTNLYGFNDNFNPKNSHVLPALLNKFHTAKLNSEPSVEIWGTGTPRREFLHVDDMASACVHIFQHVDAKDLYDDLKVSHINIGTGEDISISELAQLVQKVVGYDGSLVFDKTKPDGTPRKLLDVHRLNQLGWKHTIDLEEGIRRTYQWYVQAENLRSE
jgi:GDP-L-fucose synthase